MNSFHISSPSWRGGKWLRRICLLALVVILSEPASADDGTVKGEVFIVTKGAQNFRLGLVEILIFPEEVIQKHILERKARIKDEMPDFEKTIRSSDELLVKAKANLEMLKDLQDQKRKFNLKSGRIATLTERMEDRRQVELFEGTIASLESNKKLAAVMQQNWPASAHFFKNLPESTNSVRTNSDGKFSTTVSKTDKFALVAHATRVTPESTERYYWMVWVSLEGKDFKEIILGNHNLMSAGSKESVVSTKAD